MVARARGYAVVGSGLHRVTAQLRNRPNQPRLARRCSAIAALTSDACVIGPHVADAGKQLRAAAGKCGAELFDDAALGER